MYEVIGITRHEDTCHVLARVLAFSQRPQINVMEYVRSATTLDGPNCHCTMFMAKDAAGFTPVAESHLHVASSC